MRRLVLAVAVLALTVSAPAFASNIIVNGDFETLSHVQGLDNGLYLDGLSSGQWDVYTTIPGWTTVAGAGIEIQNGTIYVGHSPTHYVELDSNNNSAMEQIVSLGGGDYVFGFWYRPRTDTPGDNTIWAKIDGGAIILQADSTTGREDYWKFYSVTLSGLSSGNHSLVISADGISNSVGGFVDDVSLTSVPEPASMLLLGTGLVGLGRAWRKRRQ